MLQDRTFLSALPSSSLELGSVLTQSMDEPRNTTKLRSFGIKLVSEAVLAVFLALASNG